MTNPEVIGQSAGADHPTEAEALDVSAEPEAHPNPTPEPPEDQQVHGDTTPDDAS
jgi:hypothetical protein